MRVLRVLREESSCSYFGRRMTAEDEGREP